MREIDKLNGKHEDDCLLLARRWAQAARHDPPASGDFLADDLDRIAAEIERLREAIREARAWLDGEGLHNQADVLARVLDGKPMYGDERQAESK